MKRGTTVATKMKIGVVLPHWIGSLAGATPSAPDSVAIGRAAESIGFDSLWLVDHFYWEPYADLLEQGFELPQDSRGIRSGAWECWTMLAALAVATQRVELGTLVTNTGYRNPALFAHMVKTVDSLSNGRVILGLGAGDFHTEHTTHGYPWDHRVGRFEEALQIIAPLLRGERVTLDGRFYQVHDAALLPEGPRPSGPPILIGLIHGGPRMQRLVAQWADDWNTWIAFRDSRASAYVQHVSSMSAALERYGRDPSTLRRNVTVGVVVPGHDFNFPGARPLAGTSEEVAEDLHRFVALGVDHLTILLRPFTVAALDWMGQVIEILRRGE